MAKAVTLETEFEVRYKNVEKGGNTFTVADLVEHATPETTARVLQELNDPGLNAKGRADVFVEYLRDDSRLTDRLEKYGEYVSGWTVAKRVKPKKPAVVVAAAVDVGDQIITLTHSITTELEISGAHDNAMLRGYVATLRQIGEQLNNRKDSK